MYPVVYWNIILNFLFFFSEKGTGKLERNAGQVSNNTQRTFVSYYQCLVSILKGKKNIFILVIVNKIHLGKVTVSTSAKSCIRTSRSGLADNLPTYKKTHRVYHNYC